MKRSLLFILIPVLLIALLAPANAFSQSQRTTKRNFVLKQQDNESEIQPTERKSEQRSIKKRESYQKMQRSWDRKNQPEQDNDSSFYNKLQKPSRYQRSIKEREQRQKRQRRRSSQETTLSDNE